MSLSRNNIFFVYVDWTLENTPRPFYVGKGTLSRVQRSERNVYWKNITRKYGRRREVVLATKDEAYAFTEEIRFIAKFKTHESSESESWGANLTVGGEGATGWKPSREWIEARSGSNNPMYGKKRPEISEMMMGNSNPFFGHTHSDEWKRQKSESMSGAKHHAYGKLHSEVTRKRIGEAVSGERNGMHQAAENHPNACLTREQVTEIRLCYDHTRHLPQADPTRISYRQLSIEFGVSKGHVANIVAKRYWKEE